MSGRPSGGSIIAPIRTASGKDRSLSSTCGDDGRVDLLEVHVADPLRVLGDQLDAVAAVVGDVAGVEAEVHVLGVRWPPGTARSPAGSRRGCRRGEWNCTCRPYSSRIRRPSSSVRLVSRLHCSSVRLAVLLRLAGLVIAPQLGDDHDVLASDGLGQRRDVGDLLPGVVPRVRAGAGGRTPCRPAPTGCARPASPSARPDRSAGSRTGRARWPRSRPRRPQPGSARRAPARGRWGTRLPRSPGRFRW